MSRLPPPQPTASTKSNLFIPQRNGGGAPSNTATGGSTARPNAVASSSAAPSSVAAPPPPPIRRASGAVHRPPGNRPPAVPAPSTEQPDASHSTSTTRLPPRPTGQMSIDPMTSLVARLCSVIRHQESSRRQMELPNFSGANSEFEKSWKAKEKENSDKGRLLYDQDLKDLSAKARQIAGTFVSDSLNDALFQDAVKAAVAKEVAGRISTSVSSTSASAAPEARIAELETQVETLKSLIAALPQPTPPEPSYPRVHSSPNTWTDEQLRALLDRQSETHRMVTEIQPIVTQLKSDLYEPWQSSPPATELQRRVEAKFNAQLLRQKQESDDELEQYRQSTQAQLREQEARLARLEAQLAKPTVDPRRPPARSSSESITPAALAKVEQDVLQLQAAVGRKRPRPSDDEGEKRASPGTEATQSSDPHSALAEISTRLHSKEVEDVKRDDTIKHLKLRLDATGTMIDQLGPSPPVDSEREAQLGNHETRLVTVESAAKETANFVQKLEQLVPLLQSLKGFPEALQRLQAMLDATSRDVGTIKTDLEDLASSFDSEQQHSAYVQAHLKLVIAWLRPNLPLFSSLVNGHNQQNPPSLPHRLTNGGGPLTPPEEQDLQ